MMMTKSDTIEAILVLNPTADRTFLSEFSNAELGQYLQRLRKRSSMRTVAATPCVSDTEPAPCAAATGNL